MSTAPGNMPLNGPRKAAILLVLLGDEVAASIYKSLPETMVRAVTQEIAELEYVAPEAASKVLLEYYRLTQNDAFLGQGGQECASRFLAKAFGAEGARNMLLEVNRDREASSQNLDELQKIDPQLLAKFI